MGKLRFLERYRSEQGVASIEFAFVVPMLAFALMGLIDVGLYINARANMTSSVKSGVDYFLMGGQDSDTAVKIIEQAWVPRPEFSTIETERFCLCGNVEVLCSATCLDGSQPEAFKKIIVAAYYDGLLLETKYKSDETIRIR